jgi:uncharacterized protein YcbK (DUF882 family)
MRFLASRTGRVGCSASLAALLLLIGSNSLQNAAAEGDTRTISFHHIHTGEDLTITYKVNGRYDEDALKQINHELRDWRKDETIAMDPHLIDLVWEVRRELESNEPIFVVCGYRSPATNEMLRRRSSGVAKFSQHMLGKAMDFFIPGVPLEKLRETGLRAERGGVGFYPSSNFVHLDTASVRHWPRMPEAQLAAVLAKGPISTHGGDSRTRSAESRAVAAMPTRPARPKMEPVKPDGAVPGFALASATATPVELTAIARQPSAAATDPLGSRGFLQTPQSEAAQPAAADNTPSGPPRPPAEIPPLAGNQTAAASLAPWPTSLREGGGSLLSYAPADAAMPGSRTEPMGTTAMREPVQAATTIATKRTGNRATTVVSSPPPPQRPVKPGQRLSDPWIRAMIVSPSAGGFMSTAQLGAPDYRTLSPYLRKPAMSVMMTFCDDPYLGMSIAKFSGTSVVFVPTVTFVQHTASLQ